MKKSSFEWDSCALFILLLALALWAIIIGGIASLLL